MARANAEKCLSRYGEAESFASVFGVANIAKYSANPDRCIAGTAPTIHVAECAYGESVMTAWMALNIEYINLVAGVKTLSHDSALILAESILHNEDLCMLKVTDLMLFVNQFVCGKYGKFYGEVDPMVIGNALYEYKKWKAQRMARLYTEHSPLIFGDNN